jgi:hypothetical protein
MRALLAAVLTFIPAVAIADDASEKAAADLLHRRLSSERPEDLALLKAVKGRDIVVVAGEMDHIEQVLSATGVPFTVIQPAQVADYPLKSSMTLMVNCPGTMSDAGVQRIARFVKAGGLLYTTDWALRSVIEKAFPGTIAFAGALTESEVVPVSIDKSTDNIMSNVLLRRASKPQWYLEGGSFPIKVLDPEKVEVLASSAQMAKAYGAGPVVVRFRWEDGEVIHVVSHFYRQLDAVGPAVAARDAVGSFDGLSADDKKEFAKSQGSGSSVGNVESSYAFQRMTSNLLAEKQKRNVELDRTYSFTPRSDVSLRGKADGPPAPAASAPAEPVAQKDVKLRVLERKNKAAKVRDEFGNEGWVDEAALQPRQ